LVNRPGDQGGDVNGVRTPAQPGGNEGIPFASVGGLAGQAFGAMQQLVQGDDDSEMTPA
jgi:hypothetical protein